MTTEERENIIDRLTEVRGLLETYGAGAALPRLERHIQDLQDMPAPRALSSLTEGEAKECYRLATGSESRPPVVAISEDHVFVGWQHGGLEIYPDGDVINYSDYDAGECNVRAAEPVNATRVVRYLDSLGIALGE